MTMQNHTVPYRSSHDNTRPFRAIQKGTIQHRSGQDYTGPNHKTIQDLTEPCKTTHDMKQIYKDCKENGNC